MAAHHRPTQATYEVHETVKVDTSDNEDHTFCGIMFPIKAKQVIPVEHIVIRSVAVRGQLGPMTVWVSNDDGVEDEHGNYHFRLDTEHWTKVYSQTHAPSQREYCSLNLADSLISVDPDPPTDNSNNTGENPGPLLKKAPPVTIRPGRIRALYIHSTLQGDEAIVYDNAKPLINRRRARRNNAGAAEGEGGGGEANNENNDDPAAIRRGPQPRPRYEDSYISIGSAKAHLSNELFGQVPIWGWGNAWRDRREFVGRIEYGAVFQLWRPESSNLFGNNFHAATMTMLMCRSLRKDSPLALLPDECLYYILNLCRWDWFGDKEEDLKTKRKLRKRKRKIQAIVAAHTGSALHQQQSQQQSQKPKQNHSLSCPCATATAHNGGICTCGASAANLVGASCGRAVAAAATIDNGSGVSAIKCEAAAADIEAILAAAVAAANYAGGRSTVSSNNSNNNNINNNNNEEDADEGEISDESEWERAHGYRADTDVFAHQDVSSDDDQDDDFDVFVSNALKNRLLVGSGGSDTTANRKNNNA